MRIINFRINHMKEPFVDAAPEFSWQIESDENSVFQTAYQINVCDEKSEVWSSGKVLSNKQSFIKYGGALKSKTQYSVCITVWDNKGNCSALKSKFDGKEVFQKVLLTETKVRYLFTELKIRPYILKKILILRTKL